MHAPSRVCCCALGMVLPIVLTLSATSAAQFPMDIPFDDEFLYGVLPPSPPPGGKSERGLQWLEEAKAADDAGETEKARPLLEKVLLEDVSAATAREALDRLEEISSTKEFIAAIQQLAPLVPSPEVQRVLSERGVNWNGDKLTFGWIPPLVQSPLTIVYNDNGDPPMVSRHEYRVFRVAPKDWQAEVERSKKNLWQPVPMHTERKNWVPVKISAETDWNDHPTIVEMNYPKRAEIRGDFSPGAYVFVETVNHFRRETPFVVSDFSLDIFQVGEDAVMYATDAVSGEPRAGVRVELFGKSPWQPRTVHTDVHGLATVSKAKGVLLAIASYEKSLQAIAIWEGYPSQSPKAYVTTDRPIYRPGQTVHYKVVGRKTDAAGKLRMPDAREVLVEFRDPQGRQLVREVRSWNGFGSISGEFRLADEPPLGSYEIAVSPPPPATPEDPSEDSGGESYYQFEVVAYRRPDFEVVVKPNPAGTAAEEGNIKVHIEATYLVGGGVSDAHVEWSVLALESTSTSSVSEVTEPARDPKAWFYRSQEAGLHWSDRAGANFFQIASDGYWSTRKEPLTADSGRTDRNGRLEITFSPPADRVAGRYLIQATVRDAAGAEAQGEAEFDGDPDFRRIELGPDRLFYQPGEQVKARLAVFRGDGSPAANESIDIAAFEAAPRAANDEGPLAVEYESFASRIVTTNEQGEATAVFKAPTSDTLRLRARRVNGSNAQQGERRIEIPIAYPFERPTPTMRLRHFQPQPPDEFDPSPLAPPRLLHLVPDQRAYYSDEKLRLLLQCEDAPVSVLLMVEAGSGIRHAQVVPMKRTIEVIEIPVSPAWGSRCQIRAHYRKDGIGQQHAADIVIIPRDTLLDVAVNVPGDSVRPGEEVAVEVMVQRPGGEPIAAEVELAIVDDGLFQVLAANGDGASSLGLPPDIRTHFSSSYPPEVGQSSTAGNWIHEDRYFEPFPSDGWAWDVDRSGRQFGDFTPDGFVGGGMGGFGGGGFFGGGLGGFGGGGFFGGGLSLRVQQRPFVISVVPVVTDTPASRTRSNFSEVWHYAAHVVTGNDGRATLRLPAPDSLTRWRIIARAITREGQVGQAQSSVLTRQDVMLRLAAPRFYTSGDEGSVATILRNELDGEATFDVELQLEGAAGGGTKKFTLAPGMEQRVEWPLTVTASHGQVRMSASARSPQGADALELNVPVVPFGIERLAARSGVVAGDWSAEFTLPDDAIPGSAELALHVAPAGIEAVEQALPRLADYPYGCVEQTMSRFVPAVAASSALKRLKLSNPALERDLPAMVQAGLQRLYAFQHDDGGWGWWENDATDEAMTAYVVLGLATAREAGFLVDERTLQSGLFALRNMKTTPIAVYARRLAGEELPSDFEIPIATTDQDRAYLVLAGFRNVAAKLSPTPPQRNEANDIITASLTLRALLAIDRNDPRIETFTAWVMQQRRGGWWISTLDSAHAVFALAELAQDSENKPRFEILFNGKAIPVNDGNARVSGDELTVGDNRIEVRLLDAKPGDERDASARLYAAAELRYFSSALREIGADSERWFAQNGDGQPQPALAVSRRLERGVINKEGQLNWLPLASGDAVQILDRLRMVVEIASPKGAQRVLLETPLPSGGETGAANRVAHCDNRWAITAFAQLEIRDTKACTAIGAVGPGTQRYLIEFRPTRPGKYHLLPVQAFAMYEEHQRGYSFPFELRVTAAEREP